MAHLEIRDLARRSRTTSCSTACRSSSSTARSSASSDLRARARPCFSGSSPASRSADVGSIVLAGPRRHRRAAGESRGVGMAFQNFALFPHMSAFDNVASALTARRARRRTSSSDKVEKVAALLKIGHVLGHAPRELSNGQKQRTALGARAGRRPEDPAARRSAAQRRRQTALRDAPRAAFLAEGFRLNGALRHAGLQGGDGARRPHRGADRRRLRAGRDARARSIASRRRSDVARLFGDPTINLVPSSRCFAPRV